MPACANVSLQFGPYESCAEVKHRTERLEGLKVVLTSHGHTVQMEQIETWNAVCLVVNGEVVFQCDINDLDFGGDGTLDGLCGQALQAVVNSF
ncbi:PREDICTED: UPF0728 protein-like [Priapulus caudatus]|uniref:UPF0728 protein-like n=1 Tax=Priapulus caudatus TaxID=37621 RepID=A0ABM1EKB5_PRICU|nr:PREDICTED: UPF0728 protein-like [Priapulus caudatus]